MNGGLNESQPPRLLWDTCQFPHDMLTFLTHYLIMKDFKANFQNIQSMIENPWDVGVDYSMKYE